MSSFLAALTVSARRQEARLYEYMERRLNHGQRAWLECDDAEALWIDANQVAGKTVAQALDVTLHLCGMHPRQTHPSPTTQMLVGYSHEQMEPITGWIWRMMPREWMSARCTWLPVRGVVSRPPGYWIDGGPGAGSKMIAATYGQNTQRMAGTTLHRATCDEPPTRAAISELRPRLWRHRGRLRVTLTPTLDAWSREPLTWLQEEVDASGSKWRVFNWGATAAASWLDGAPSPLFSAARIEAMTAGLNERERAMRLGRAWGPEMLGGELTAFGAANIVRVRPNDLRGWSLYVGIDHGSTAGKSCAALVAVRDGGGDRPRWVILGESVSDGFWTVEQDAAGIIGMLADCGLKYDDVDGWCGDVPFGGARHIVRKSNADLRRELARQTGRAVADTTVIEEPRKMRGSMQAGFGAMNTILSRRDDDGVPHGRVAVSCTRTVKAAKEFDGSPTHPGKDVLDAARYAIELACRPSRMGMSLRYASGAGAGPVVRGRHVR